VILVEDERERPKPEFEEIKDQLANQLRQAATQEAIQELRKKEQYTMFDMNGNEVEPMEEQSPASGNEGEGMTTGGEMPETVDAQEDTQPETESDTDTQ
jgi:hypothetical protein